jgi:hypothetical protein
MNSINSTIQHIPVPTHSESGNPETQSPQTIPLYENGPNGPCLVGYFRPENLLARALQTQHRLATHP